MNGAEFYTGCRVLAKRETDGFYYLGTIVHQLQDRGGLFMVTFDKPLAKEDTTAEMILPQLTCQPDMINITKAHGHSIVPGDTVLAPWDPQMRKYGPGRIVSGTELRNQLKDGEGHGLMVLFWNGIQTHVPKDLALWIPASHHEQIIKELQLYVFRPECSRDHHCSHMNRMPACCINHCVSATTSYYHCPIQSCPLLNSSFLMNNCWNKEIKADQMKELPSSQEIKKALSSPSSSDLSEDEDEVKDENLNSTGLESVSRSVNTDISCLKKFYTEMQSRPAWRYWKRGSPEPHHKKPGRIVKLLNGSDTWSEKNSDSGHSSCNFATTNSSSLFEMVPNTARKDVTMKEVFDWTKPKSHLKAVTPLAFALYTISAKPI
ncbi:uncharacterized protein C11orf16 homolog [Trichomycterus rosablanca]|uniref:uncharacterized protein C11orf16 homolog n=1 Tax=Trichomycterus rosablanca TaxID=2290929 RepID=UPI002F35C87A